METSWQLQDAKAKFSEVVDRALQGEPQLVTKRGQAAVVVISHAEYKRYKQAQKSLLSALGGAPKGELKTQRDRTPVTATRIG